MKHKCQNCGEEADIEVKDEETKHYCSKCYFSNKKLKQ